VDLKKINLSNTSLYGSDEARFTITIFNAGAHHYTHESC